MLVTRPSVLARLVLEQDKIKETVKTEEVEEIIPSLTVELQPKKMIT